MLKIVSQGICSWVVDQWKHEIKVKEEDCEESRMLLAFLLPRLDINIELCIRLDIVLL